MNIPKKSGQIVKFHTPLADEKSIQQYVVLELHEDSDHPRAKIMALGTGLPFPPVSVVAIKDLETVEANTSDLLGQVVYIITKDSVKILGRVVKIQDEQVNLEMTAKEVGVETNVIVTIIDKDGCEHLGVLFVS